MKNLTVTRSKDRTKLAEMIVALATSLDAEAKINLEFCGEREVMVNIRAKKGLCLDVELDGGCRQQKRGTFVLSWHVDHLSDTCLANEFGNVNQAHYQKATYIAEGIDGPNGLLGQIEKGLKMAKNETAFNWAREYVYIEKHGKRKDYWDSLSIRAKIPV